MSKNFTMSIFTLIIKIPVAGVEEDQILLNPLFLFVVVWFSSSKNRLVVIVGFFADSVQLFHCSFIGSLFSVIGETTRTISFA